MGPFTGSVDRLLRSGGWTDQHEADIADADEAQDFPQVRRCHIDAAAVHSARNPPSTAITVPVAYCDAGMQRKATAPGATALMRMSSSARFRTARQAHHGQGRAVEGALSGVH